MRHASEGTKERWHETGGEKREVLSPCSKKADETAHSCLGICDGTLNRRKAHTLNTDDVRADDDDDDDDEISGWCSRHRSSRTGGV